MRKVEVAGKSIIVTVMSVLVLTLSVALLVRGESLNLEFTDILLDLFGNFNLGDLVKLVLFDQVE